jgi:tripartite-type tricarboxylate transporter receptor subunit TctC
MRVMAVEMTKTFGQPVVVENRSGASGHIAAEAVARAVPDGQMIMIHTASMITSRPLYASSVMTCCAISRRSRKS